MPSIVKGTWRLVKCIGGHRQSIGTEEFQVTFNKLGGIIDGEFLLINEKISFLLSISEIKKNGLQISIPRSSILIGDRE